LRYKHLKRKINEHLEDPAISNAQEPETPLFDVDNPKSLERINLYLSRLNKTNFQDPRFVLTAVRAKLNLIGLDFNYYGRDELGENETFEVKRYGEVTTEDPKTGKIKKDDAQRLKLIVNTSKFDDGQNIISIKLVNSNASGEVMDSNDNLKGNENN
jgi:hypothetical protein